MVQSRLARIGLADRRHRHRGHRPGGHAGGIEGRLEGEGVHHRGDHAQRVAGGAIDPPRRRDARAPDHVTAPDHESDLKAGLQGLGDIVRQGRQERGMQPVPVRGGQGLTRQLHEDAAKRFGLRHGASPLKHRRKAERFNRKRPLSIARRSRRSRGRTVLVCHLGDRSPALWRDEAGSMVGKRGTGGGIAATARPRKQLSIQKVGGVSRARQPRLRWRNRVLLPSRCPRRGHSARRR